MVITQTWIVPRRAASSYKPRRRSRRRSGVSQLLTHQDCGRDSWIPDLWPAALSAPGGCCQPIVELHLADSVKVTVAARYAGPSLDQNFSVYPRRPCAWVLHPVLRASYPVTEKLSFTLDR